MDAADDDIVFRPAWRLNDPQIVRHAKGLWSRENVPAVYIDGRESEICAAAYSGEKLVAVSTASLFHSRPMRHKLFAYRCMIASNFRQQNLAWRISAYSFKLLQDWSAQNPQEKILGLMITVETDKFTAGLRKPVREKFGFTMHFIGYTPSGQQVRVVWFDHAELDDGAAAG